MTYSGFVPFARFPCHLPVRAILEKNTCYFFIYSRHLKGSFGCCIRGVTKRVNNNIKSTEQGFKEAISPVVMESGLSHVHQI